MPWCDDCSKFWEAPQLGQAGACPTCGRLLAPVPVATVAAGAGETTAEAPTGANAPGEEEAAGPETTPKRDGAPWHFKLLVVGVTVYMIYRIYWLIEWLPKHI